MSWLLLGAAFLMVSLGLVHSLLGELLLFRHIQGIQGLPSVPCGEDYWRRTLRITWHVPSVLGFGLASIVVRLALLDPLGDGERFVVRTIALSLALCAVVTMAGTKGQHPAWVAFLAAAVLCWTAVS